jgi:hypothetical protein
VFLVDDALKEVCSQNEEKGRKRIPLSHPTPAWKVLSRHSIKNDEVPVARILWIQLHQISSNPRCSIVLMITLCSIVSKAFVKSSLRIMISFLDCWH